MALSIEIRYLFILYTYYQIKKLLSLNIITPLPNSQFIYNASRKIWNIIRETIAKSDLSISIYSFISTLKKHILPYKNVVLFMSGIIIILKNRFAGLSPSPAVWPFISLCLKQNSIIHEIENPRGPYWGNEYK